MITSPSPEPYRVLVVNDSDDLLAAVTFALRTLGGFVVETASDGAEGLQKAVELHPDCVVIDVVMPELNGIQLVRALRGDPATAEIPLVILSALIQESDYARGMYAGADQYLTKPTKPQDLVDAIRRAIALSDAERQERMRALAEDGED